MEQKQNDTFNKNVNRHLSCLGSDAAVGNKSNRKTERDKATIRLMIDIYCRHRLGLMETPERFKALADYAGGARQSQPARTATSTAMPPRKGKR